MLIYYVVLFFIIGLWPLCPRGAQGRRAYIIVCSTLLFLLAALRADTVGVDLEGYERQFLTDLGLPYRDMSFYYGKEPFYHAFSHIIGQLYPSFQFLLAVIALCYACATGYSIWRWSRHPQISYVMLFTWVYFCFSLSGLRQTMAVAIIWSLGYTFLIQRRIIPFVAMVWIASLFHKTAWVFLLAYPLACLPLTWPSLLAWGAALGAVLKLGPTAVAYLLSLEFFAGSEYAAYEVQASTRGINTALLYIGILLLAFLYRRVALELAATTAPSVTAAVPASPVKSAASRLTRRAARALGLVGDAGRDRRRTGLPNLVLYNLVFLGIAFQLLVPVIPEFFRVSMYFSYAIVLLVPNILSAIPDRRASRTYAYVTAAFFMTSFAVIGMGAGADQYHFFWESH